MKDLLKKWWFWLIIILAICIPIFIIIVYNSLFAPKHSLAYKVQNLNNDSTVYESAGGHSIVIQSDYRNSESSELYNIFELIRNNLKELKKYDYVLLQVYTDNYLFETKYDTDSEKELEENIYKTTTREKELKEISNAISDITAKGENIIIGAGKYTVGEDIKSGKYDVILQSGSGNFWLENKFVIETFDNDMKKYSNLVLENGDIINLSGNLQILLQAK